MFHSNKNVKLTKVLDLFNTRTQIIQSPFLIGMNQHHKGIPEKNHKLISVDTIKNIILINNHALFINFFDNQKLVKSRFLEVNIHHGHSRNCF